MDEILYRIIKGRVSSRHLERIIGKSLYSGIVNYQQYSSNIEIDFAELLLRTLDRNAIFNGLFQEFLINYVLNEYQIAELSKIIHIVSDDDFISRKRILEKSKKRIGQALINLLLLPIDKYAYVDSVDSVIVEEVLICPDPSRFLSLHDYQKRIKDEIIKNLIEIPDSRMLVHMPTGSGKTKTCIEAVVDFVRTRPFEEGLVIWFAHSNELCMQAYSNLIDIWKVKGDSPLPVFKMFGDNDALEDILHFKKAVLFVGFQKFMSLQRSSKENHLKIRTHLSTNTQLVIIDEAHKSLAETYKSAINYVSTMPNCRVIGLTATPGRSSDISDPSNTILSDFFKNKLIGVTDDNGCYLPNSLEYLQEHKFLAKIEHKPIEVDLSSFSEEELKKISISGELEQSHIDKIVESPLRNKIIVDEIDRALQDENKNLILVFACNVNHCILLQKLLEFQNINSEVVLAETPSQLRSKYISDFKSGKLKVLINFGVLTTGFDAPRLKTLIIARHTNSMILYSQMIGRALRGPKNGGNEVNHVIDLVDNISSLGNPQFLFTYWEEFWGKNFCLPHVND